VNLADGIRELEQSVSCVGRSMADIDLTVFGLGPDPVRIEELLELGFNRVVFHVPPAEEGKVLRLLDRYQAVAERFAG